MLNRKKEKRKKNLSWNFSLFLFHLPRSNHFILVVVNYKNNKKKSSQLELSLALICSIQSLLLVSWSLSVCASKDIKCNYGIHYI